MPLNGYFNITLKAKMVRQKQKNKRYGRVAVGKGSLNL